MTGTSLRRRVRHRLSRSSERRSLLEGLPKDSVGAEVGVFKGDYAERICAVVRPAQLHLIDPWLFGDDERYAGSSWGGRIARSQADMDAVYERSSGVSRLRSRPAR